MSELQIFNYGKTPVRMIDKDGSPWWVLADVCRVLGLTTPAKVATRLDDDEKGMSQIHTPGGSQSMTIINESGLYKVILRSDKPEAKKFTRWVTHEVLPAIRRSGRYETAQPKTETEHSQAERVDLIFFNGKPALTTEMAASIFGVCGKAVRVRIDKDRHIRGTDFDFLKGKGMTKLRKQNPDRHLTSSAYVIYCSGMRKLADHFSKTVKQVPKDAIDGLFNLPRAEISLPEKTASHQPVASATALVDPWRQAGLQINATMFLIGVLETRMTMDSQRKLLAHTAKVIQKTFRVLLSLGATC